MLIGVNHQELSTFINDISAITHIAVAIYDTDFNVIQSSKNKLCDFCTEVRSNPLLEQKCIDCDHYALHECARTKKPYIYHCHMNLVEITLPVTFNDIIVGYMLFGQFRNQTDLSDLISFIEKRAKEYNLKVDRLLKSVNDIPYYTDEQILSISNLMKMCVRHIWSNQIININQSSLANSIELFIENHLDEDLSVKTLCEKFSISRSTLYELSKENFNFGITDYVQYCRLKAAKKLLKTKYELSIVEVSESVGIKDASYFSKFFKKHVGLSPKQYQLKYKSEQIK